MAATLIASSTFADEIISTEYNFRVIIPGVVTVEDLSAIGGLSAKGGSSKSYTTKIKDKEFVRIVASKFPPDISYIMNQDAPDKRAERMKRSLVKDIETNNRTLRVDPNSVVGYVNPDNSLDLSFTAANIQTLSNRYFCINARIMQDYYYVLYSVTNNTPEAAISNMKDLKEAFIVTLDTL
jgi:hypothetical protein